MKSERVTFLSSPKFKDFLVAEAKRAGTSVGELVRRRCEPRANEEDALALALVAELRRAVAEARNALQESMAEAKAVTVALSTARAKRSESTLPRSASRKSRRAEAEAA
jgi:hypothetical protein